MSDIETPTAKPDLRSEVAGALSGIGALWRAWCFVRDRRRLADEARVRRSAIPIDRSKPVVFVSYRTAEHAEVARALRLSLEELGFSVWFDEDHATMPSRILYLDAWLEEAMCAADVMVLMVPRRTEFREPDRAKYREEAQWALIARWLMFVAIFASFSARADGSPPSWVAELDDVDEDERSRRMRDHALFSVRMLRRSVPTELRALWMKPLYNVNLTKRYDESWQMWERRVAEHHGLAVVTAGVQAEADANEVPTDVVLDPLRLDDDVREFLLPRLIGLRRRSGPPPLTPQAQRLWDRRRRYAIAGAVALTAFSPLLIALWIARRIVLLARWIVQPTVLLARSMAQRIRS